jgi:hypothetical protein
VLRLSADDFHGATAELGSVEVRQDLRCVGYCSQRIAKLMTQHRKELVLRPIRRLGLSACCALAIEQLKSLLLDCLAFPYQRSDWKRHRRDGDHECLKQQERLVLASHHEWTAAADGRPYRNR